MEKWILPCILFYTALLVESIMLVALMPHRLAKIGLSTMAHEDELQLKTYKTSSC